MPSENLRKMHQLNRGAILVTEVTGECQILKDLLELSGPQKRQVAHLRDRGPIIRKAARTCDRSYSRL